MIKTYPNAPGYKTTETETSKEAAESITSKAATLRERCYQALKGAAMTADEVAELLGEDKLSIRPRVAELNKQVKLFDTALRRKNSSGKNAVVWRAISQLKQPEML